MHRILQSEGEDDLLEKEAARWAAPSGFVGDQPSLMAIDEAKVPTEPAVFKGPSAAALRVCANDAAKVAIEHRPARPE